MWSLKPTYVKKGIREYDIHQNSGGQFSTSLCLILSPPLSSFFPQDSNSRRLRKRRSAIDVGGSILLGHVNLDAFLGSLFFSLSLPSCRPHSSSHFFLQSSHSRNNAMVFCFIPHNIFLRARKKRIARRRKKTDEHNCLKVSSMLKWLYAKFSGLLNNFFCWI